MYPESLSYVQYQTTPNCGDIIQKHESSRIFRIGIILQVFIKKRSKNSFRPLFWCY